MAQPLEIMEMFDIMNSAIEEKRRKKLEEQETTMKQKELERKLPNG